MVKVEAIIDFNYKKYNKIKKLNSFNEIKEGKLFKGDIFEITNEEALYLTGKNDSKIIAVRVLEVIPKEGSIKKRKNSIITKKGNTEVIQTKGEISINIARKNTKKKEEK